MTIVTDFDVGETVVIRQIDVKAVVLTIYIDLRGTTYYIAWFNGGTRESGTFFSSELSKVTE